MLYSIAFPLASALAAWATDITVLVGQDGLAFTPSSAMAQVGDNIIFEFRAKNHSVTQSTFADPCTRMTTPAMGIDSGFQAIAPNATEFPQWSITVDNASAPLWFFCAQTTPVVHCQQGMVFALNPTLEKTFDAFLANAKNSADTSGSPSGASSASGFVTSVTVIGAPSPTGGSVTSIPNASVSPIGAPPAGAQPTVENNPSESAARAAPTTPANAGIRVTGGVASLLIAGAFSAMLL
ncbi:hypothetical protein AX16_008889 [Volvariella volvacea WC 439]|nr:hypothetical protein AX16_008889 [Volvariella volvacea WC 439]